MIETPNNSDTNVPENQQTKGFCVSLKCVWSSILAARCRACRPHRTLCL